ncbi:MAG: arginine repressor [Anaerovoracaceae bacterium]|nr:arginine repressor [Bacillota bacterium]MDY2671420.1 arginine repressor [Anaerovoracaceae bacterium]
MRYSRQEKILELISNNEIETQEALVSMLAKEGYSATQATVSRDIKELRLVKRRSASGKYIYSRSEESHRAGSAGRYESIFRNTVNSIEYSGNILVIKTVSGCANAAGEALDSMSFEEIVGTLAGDNTLFAVVDSPEHAPEISARLRSMLGGE